MLRPGLTFHREEQQKAGKDPQDHHVQPIPLCPPTVTPNVTSPWSLNTSWDGDPTLPWAAVPEHRQTSGEELFLTSNLPLQCIPALVSALRQRER